MLTNTSQFCEKRVLELRAAEKEIKGPCVFLNALKPNTAKGHPVLNDKELGADAWILYFAGQLASEAIRLDT